MILNCAFNFVQGYTVPPPRTRETSVDNTRMINELRAREYAFFFNYTKFTKIKIISAPALQRIVSSNPRGWNF